MKSFAILLIQAFLMFHGIELYAQGMSSFNGRFSVGIERVGIEMPKYSHYHMTFIGLRTGMSLPLDSVAVADNDGGWFFRPGACIGTGEDSWYLRLSMDGLFFPLRHVYLSAGISYIAFGDDAVRNRNFKVVNGDIFDNVMIEYGIGCRYGRFDVEAELQNDIRAVRIVEYSTHQEKSCFRMAFVLSLTVMI